jgi:hypothetical protein
MFAQIEADNMRGGASGAAARGDLVETQLVATLEVERRA